MDVTALHPHIPGAARLTTEDRLEELLETFPFAGPMVAKVPRQAGISLKSIVESTNNLADPATAERRTGYVVGGISPLGQRNPSRTVLDASAFALDAMYVSGGRRGLDIELAPADLSALIGALSAQIASAPIASA